MRRAIVAVIGAIIALMLLGMDNQVSWWRPLRQLKAWHLNQKGVQEYRTNELDKALNSFREARKIAGDHPVLLFNEGTALLAKGNFKEAEQSLRSSLKGLSSKQIRQQATIHYNLGNLYFAQKRWDEAAKAYIATLKRTPNDWDAKFNLELVLRQQQRKPPQQQKKQLPPPPLPPVNERKPLSKQLQQLQRRLTAPWHGERDW